MAYSNFSNDTGQTPERRAEEAAEIVNMLADVLDQMSDKEQGFVESMDGCTDCSPKQLFWLRDLKEKYL